MELTAVVTQQQVVSSHEVVSSISNNNKFIENGSKVERQIDCTK